MPKKKIPGKNPGEKVPEKIYDFRNNFETGTIRVDIFNKLDLHIFLELHLKFLITRLFDFIFT